MNAFGLVLMRWMNLEPIIQSEMSQKEKNKYILTHIYRIQKNGSVQLVSRVRLCDPMNRSTPGLPVYHQLLEILKLVSIELITPSNNLILCCPLLLPPIFHKGLFK